MRESSLRRKPTRLQELLNHNPDINEALDLWQKEMFGPSGRGSQETDGPESEKDTHVRRFKLAVMAPAVSDDEIEKLFLDLRIDSESDIEKAVNIISFYRPTLLKALTAKYVR